MNLKTIISEMTPRSVEQWLESQEGTGARFRCDDCYACLFAMYLSEQMCGPVHVGRFMAHFSGAARDQNGGLVFRKGEYAALPDWAVRVIAAFDSGHENQARGVKGSLRILRECCWELGAVRQ